MKAEDGIFLHEGQYERKVLEKFNITDCKDVKNPLVPEGKPNEVKEEDKEIIFPYCELVGS